MFLLIFEQTPWWSVFIIHLKTL